METLSHLTAAGDPDVLSVQSLDAALNGISAQTLKIAVGGESVDLLHVPREKEGVNIVLQLPLASRSNPEELLVLRIRSGDANALPEPAAAGIKLERFAVLAAFRSRGLCATEFTSIPS